jgi:hypothetical protein
MISGLRNMPENSNNFAPSFDTNQQRELLERHFPRAGYWFNMLPMHPFIHGIHQHSLLPEVRAVCKDEAGLARSNTIRL